MLQHQLLQVTLARGHCRGGARVVMLVVVQGVGQGDDGAAHRAAG